MPRPLSDIAFGAPTAEYRRDYRALSYVGHLSASASATFFPANGQH
jgi:hypothetical protein